MNGDSDSRLLESGPSRTGPPGATRASKNARGSQHFCYTMVRLQLLLLLLLVVCGWMSERMNERDRLLLLSCLSHLQLQLQQRGRPLWPRKAEPQPALRAWPAGSRLGRPPLRLRPLLRRVDDQREQGETKSGEAHQRLAHCFL